MDERASEEKEVEKCNSGDARDQRQGAKDFKEGM